MKQLLVLRGRTFSRKDLQTIKTTISHSYAKGRAEISRQICVKLDWRQPNGWLKDRACRDVLLKLESNGVVKLPPRKIERVSKKTLNQSDIRKKWLLEVHSITDYFKPKIEMVKGTKKEMVWNELVRSFHYQSYSVIVGHNIKYIAYFDDIPVACLGWGSAAWSVDVRDKWLQEKLGWKRKDIIENLPRIVNNVRFLILPWVRVKNLASTLLSMMEDIVKKDWNNYYNVRPILLETFVERARFAGTCYKAANWIYIGQTKGSSKRGNGWIKHENKKDMFLRPLSLKS